MHIHIQLKFKLSDQTIIMIFGHAILDGFIQAITDKESKLNTNTMQLASVFLCD